jgi:hypothetical protein
VSARSTVVAERFLEEQLRRLQALSEQISEARRRLFDNAELITRSHEVAYPGGHGSEAPADRADETAARERPRRKRRNSDF